MNENEWQNKTTPPRRDGKEGGKKDGMLGRVGSIKCSL